jgi:hypothetical protein
MSSGAPFNIVTGRDSNGDSLFLDRPAFAANPNAPGVIRTIYGDFLLNPGPNDTIIPRDYGRGPGMIMVNLRLGKTWGFGGGGERADNGPDGGPPMMRGGGPGMGGPRGGGMHGGGPGMFGGGAAGNRRIDLQLRFSF